MKSNLFENAGLSTKEFSEHLEKVVNLDEPQKKIILKGLPNIYRAMTGSERRLAKEKLIEELNVALADANQAIQILLYLHANFDPFRDSVETYYSDLLTAVSACSINLEDGQKLFFRDFVEQVSSDSLRKRKRMTAGNILPNLIGLDAEIDYRVSVATRFDWRTDTADSYTSVTDGLVPVAILEFKRSSGDPIFFQCEEDEIDMIINRLAALKKDLESSRTAIAESKLKIIE